MTNNKPARLFLSPPHMTGGELDLIRDAFETNYIAPLGPMVDAFEREFAAYTCIPHCLALASGTAAMHLALRELGVGPGDEVVASSLTFIGSVSPATFLGASVAFIDSDEQTWNMDLVLLADELAECARRRGKLPKAVIPTDLYGQCCDLERIKQVCERYEIPVVADAAEAMGSRYQRDYGTTGLQDNETAGPRGAAPHPTLSPNEAERQIRSPKTELRSRESQAPSEVRGPVVSSSSGPGQWVHAGYGAKAAVFSFNGNKIMTTSGGGMLASDDERFIEHARKLSQQARDPAPHYEHSEIGYNYRMSNILAAIGRGQLRVLDERVAAKRRIFEQYRQLLGDLPGITFMPESPYVRCNRWLTVILIDQAGFGSTPEQVRLALEAENIESRPIWKPMHLQPVFQGFRIRGGAVSERLFRKGLCLPSGTAVTDTDLERVSVIIRNCCHPARRNAAYSAAVRTDGQRTMKPLTSNGMVIPFYRPSITQDEINEVVDCLKSGWLTTGPRAKQFEQEFARYVTQKHALGLNSCTAALHLALGAIGLRAGDMAVVPTMTFAATAEVVRYFNATPLLVDCRESDFNLDVADAERRIEQALGGGGKVVAILPVHYGGQIGDVAGVAGLARRFGLKVIEDAAHCCPAYYREGGEGKAEMLKAEMLKGEWGTAEDPDYVESGKHSQLSTLNHQPPVNSQPSTIHHQPAVHSQLSTLNHQPSNGWLPVGASADITCFSFYATKGITTGEGGMACTQRDDYAERMRIMSLHGISKDAWKRSSAEESWYYEIVAPGFKYNLTDIAAAIGIHQLRRADEMHRKRAQWAALYSELLGDVEELILPEQQADRIHSWHLYVVRLRLDRLKINRAEVIEELKRKGITTSVHWMPLHEHPYYREKYGYKPEDFPVAARLYPEVITLPLYPDMTEGEVVYVCDTLEDTIAANLLTQRRKGAKAQGS